MPTSIILNIAQSATADAVSEQIRLYDVSKRAKKASIAGTMAPESD